MDLTLNLIQQTALVVLRTLIGWHFLYEGYVKVLGPAWSRDGVPLARFSSAGYLRSATGTELKGGPERALASARSCIAEFDAIEKKTRIEITA